MRFSVLSLAVLLAADAVAQTVVLDPEIPLTRELERLLEESFGKGVIIAREPAPEACRSGLGDLDEEQAASRGAYKRARANLSLQKQYEQEMYFADARLRLIDRVCRDGKIRLNDYGYQTAAGNLEMNRKACAIVAKDCKPRKHW